MGRDTRRDTLDALRRLNEYELEQFGDPETLTRISQYELAFRMQMAVPDAMDIRQEPESIREEYWANPGASSFATGSSERRGLRTPLRLTVTSARRLPRGRPAARRRRG